MIKPVFRPGTKEWRDYMQRYKDRTFFTNGRDANFRKEEQEISFEEALRKEVAHYDLMESLKRK